LKPLPALTLRDVLKNEIENDRRNVEQISVSRQDSVNRSIAICARRYIEALDFGDETLLFDAEDNLRLALDNVRS
jgi:hypothetical protein